MSEPEGSDFERRLLGRGTTVALRVTGSPWNREESLAALEEMIKADPDAILPRFAYACALEDLGRMVAAQKAYVEVLDREPTHLGALTNLGSLLHAAGVHDVARAFYTKAVVEHPDDPLARINLGNALVEDGELEAARFHYEAALKLRSDHPNAHFALSVLLRRLGDEDGALRHHQLAFVRPWIRVEAYHGTAPPLCVLLLVAANGGNVVTTLLLDDRVMQTYVLVAEGYRPDLELPPHHLIFNAIGDADRSPEALAMAQTIAERATVPVLNRPENVLASGRSVVTQRLRALPNVTVPRTELIAREALTADELERRGFTFPLLLRSPGFHTGRFFEHVADADALPAAVAQLPGEGLFAIEFLDVSDAHGDFRKYRAIFIGDRLYPLHLAISRNWKVHYFSADMRERPEHRAEEEAFLEGGFDRLGDRVAAGLDAIRATLGLDYGGIDFGIDRSGNVALFEANATMAIFYPGDDERFEYRRPSVERIIAAFRALAIEKGKLGGYQG